MTRHTPTDQVPKHTEIARRRALYQQANRDARALRTLFDRQKTGGLTRCEGAVLSRMVLANMRATIRKERTYRPTRAGIAKDTGYSVRSVSRALSRLKALGVIRPARYAKGGRDPKGQGLSTEWVSGGIVDLAKTLHSLGYRLGKVIAARLNELGRWCAAVFKRPKVTGTKWPGIIGENTTAPAQWASDTPTETRPPPAPGSLAYRALLNVLTAKKEGDDHAPSC